MDLNQEGRNEVTLSFEEWGDEQFLKISNSDTMRPFFMSVVSDSDHWMFISSNGGLSVGRKNAEFALFPYYTDDKITEFADITGSKSLFQINYDQESYIWEPFSNRKTNIQPFTRNIYKSIYGNKIVFEEELQDLKITYRYCWATSDEFGFIKTSTITNHNSKSIEVRLLDGLQNIMPYGVTSDLQRASSNLVDAYKRSELHKASGLGIFALSAIIVDKAEPSEALKANVVWSLGLENPTFLLSSKQLDLFRGGKPIEEEVDIKGEKGAYFVSAHVIIPSGLQKSWQIMADVNKNHSQVVKLISEIQSQSVLKNQIENDIKKGTINLINLVAAADGIQNTEDKLQDCRNFSNVLFNIMRGGIFDNGYIVDNKDYIKYLLNANTEVSERHKNFIQTLTELIDYNILVKNVIKTNDEDLIRLTIEYLPLKFSRRHGDPSRPWNKFSINLKDENTGEKILDYEGNWRDIFQNWEALAYSFPEYIDGMLFKFLNASTFDGYNPYRITKSGFDWETIEPDDPWSYIGYWGDHQIIYLQKFLEIIDKFKPGALQEYFDKDWFVYASVPYKIKPYENIVANPKDTIAFDHDWDTKIRQRRLEKGADGAILRDNDNSIYHINLIEKLLATLLSKISNFIPDGGIWLNTQRPEWNDANNALVGNGVSMVTLFYLRRFLVFFQHLLTQSELEQVKLSSELIEFYHSVRETLENNLDLLKNPVSDHERKQILDKLGTAASEYRSHIYSSGFWGKKRSSSLDGLRRFVRVSLEFVDHTIQNNQRKDGLFHAYNIMTYDDKGVHLSRLDEMLEGQVAVLSSGKLNGNQSLEVLEAMKRSALFRSDQYSYILYPNKDLPGFLQKNIIPQEEALSSELIMKCVAQNNIEIVEKDVDGQYHFNGNFKNANDLKIALENLDNAELIHLKNKEAGKLLEIFEKVFNHKAFTGRSGTFYGYEGLGSIYWHMVSKLLLAVQECCLKALDENENPKLIGRLLDHYYEIQAGIGVHKSPELYGAFPTDPYSHTPMNRGAQQPGMTGQVKEDILCRLGELGVVISNGHLKFWPCLLRKSEFLTQPKNIFYSNLNGKQSTFLLEKGQLFFTYCQVPIIYQLSNEMSLELTFNNGSILQLSGHTLSQQDSYSVFYREDKIEKIIVKINENVLK